MQIIDQRYDISWRALIMKYLSDNLNQGSAITFHFTLICFVQLATLLGLETRFNLIHSAMKFAHHLILFQLYWQYLVSYIYEIYIYTHVIYFTMVCSFPSLMHVYLITCEVNPKNIGKPDSKQNTTNGEL